MRRLFRILLTTATVISFLLAIVTATLWIRSDLLISDQFIHHSPHPAQQTHTEISLQSLDGMLAFRWMTEPSLETVYFHRSATSFQLRRDPFDGLYYFVFHYPPQSFSYDSFWKRMGFAFQLPIPVARSFGILALPHWLLLLLLSLLPLLRLRLHLRDFIRRRRGLCPTCGYDMRASPNLCPECGASPRGATA